MVHIKHKFHGKFIHIVFIRLGTILLHTPNILMKNDLCYSNELFIRRGVVYAVTIVYFDCAYTMPGYARVSVI